MKLIIDIPEDVYKRTVFYREFRDLNDCVKTIKALENGTPLDDVKAEIEHMACRQYEHRLTLDRQEVIDILDNIGNTESEVQNASSD